MPLVTSGFEAFDIKKSFFRYGSLEIFRNFYHSSGLSEAFSRKFCNQFKLITGNTDGIVIIWLVYGNNKSNSVWISDHITHFKIINDFFPKYLWPAQPRQNEEKPGQCPLLPGRGYATDCYRRILIYEGLSHMACDGDKWAGREILYAFYLPGWSEREGGWKGSTNGTKLAQLVVNTSCMFVEDAWAFRGF